MLSLFTIYMNMNFKAIVVQEKGTVVNCCRIGSVTWRSVTQRP